ncbi:MAG: metal ABC transporter permease [Chlamydiales bacterium]|nr:metal ABC transporter permease [Chlamydiia bacterium]MCP5507713.1 metal ABC transporter permease [Chlamydiales bacterium]
MLTTSLTDYFFDPVLRAPTIGCMLMCFSAGLIGVIVFLRKQSLIGEALSHAAYPGVILGVIIAASVESISSGWLQMMIMSGAFVTSMLGMAVIMILIRRFRVRQDSALCFVLSAFFGIGLTLASHVQFAFSSLYNQVQVYLYGQAATMTDIHIELYALLALALVLVVSFLFKEILTITFDQDYARSLGINTRPIDILFFVLTVFAIVIGIRSVGVVLMSAMLIAPAAAARQFTNRLSIMFLLAGLFGLCSGYLGNVLSVEVSHWLFLAYPGTRLVLPTGPMIVMVAFVICMGALLFAPERGMALRTARAVRFRYRCMCENVLKAIWRKDPEGTVSLDDIELYQSAPRWYLWIVLHRLVYNGWIEKLGGGAYRLSHEGKLWATQIVRLHRLWEVYLADYLGFGSERVHKSAEEMEHILTPELEKALTVLLKNPVRDPHKQPIPPGE